MVGVDRETDLAVLKIEAANLPTLSFFESDKLRQGQIVIALGSPLGLENSLTVGFISAPERHLDETRPVCYVQTDAPINPGNSGGPMLDIEGRVAGINTMILSQSGGSGGIGFAIPSNLVLRICHQLRTEGRIRRGSIGVIAQDITPRLSAALGIGHHPEVIFADVLPHSAAEAADIEPGDIVLAIDGKPVDQANRSSTPPSSTPSATGSPSTCCGGPTRFRRPLLSSRGATRPAVLPISSAMIPISSASSSSSP